MALSWSGPYIAGEVADGTNYATHTVDIGCPIIVVPPLRLGTWTVTFAFEASWDGVSWSAGGDWATVSFLVTNDVPDLYDDSFVIPKLMRYLAAPGPGWYDQRSSPFDPAWAWYTDPIPTGNMGPAYTNDTAILRNEPYSGLWTDGIEYAPGGAPNDDQAFVVDYGSGEPLFLAGANYWWGPWWALASSESESDGHPTENVFWPSSLVSSEWTDPPLADTLWFPLDTCSGWTSPSLQSLQSWNGPGAATGAMPGPTVGELLDYQDTIANMARINVASGHVSTARITPDTITDAFGAIDPGYSYPDTDTLTTDAPTSGGPLPHGLSSAYTRYVYYARKSVAFPPTPVPGGPYWGTLAGG
jgi:hypothetical protein